MNKELLKKIGITIMFLALIYGGYGLGRFHGTVSTVAYAVTHESICNLTNGYYNSTTKLCHVGNMSNIGFKLNNMVAHSDNDKDNIITANFQMLLISGSFCSKYE